MAENRHETIVHWYDLIAIRETVMEFGDEDARESIERILSGIKGHEDTLFRVVVEDADNG